MFILRFQLSHSQSTGSVNRWKGSRRLGTSLRLHSSRSLTYDAFGMTEVTQIVFGRSSPAAPRIVHGASEVPLSASHGAVSVGPTVSAVSSSGGLGASGSLSPFDPCSIRCIGGDSAGGLRAAGSSCLDRSSLSYHLGGLPIGTLRSDHWRISEFHFASGHVEIRASRQSSVPTRPKSDPVVNGVDRDCGGASRSDAERRAANGARSRATVRRRCWGLNADRLVTLTKRGGFATRVECWDALQRWRRLCKPFSWWKDYVAVLELHTGGGPNDGKFHIHLGLRGFAPIGLALRLWYRALGGSGYEQGSDTPGGIDLGTGRGRNRPQPRGRIAWYLAKYVAKDFGADGTLQCGQRAFSSAGCQRGVTVNRWVCPIGIGGAPIAAFVRGLRAALRLVPGELRVFEWPGGDAHSPGFVVYALKAGEDR